MKLLAIDPGPQISGWVITDGGVVPELIDFGITETIDLIQMVENWVEIDRMAVEMVASYGMAVGASVFETCVAIGQLIHAFKGDSAKVYRKDVKMTLCQSMRAKDANIRQAILDRYPVSGGGETPQIGIKKQPGPLYGVSSHVWSALAVAITVGVNMDGYYGLVK